MAPVCVNVSEPEYLKCKDNSGKFMKPPGKSPVLDLSKDIFERRTSTGSGLFSFLGRGFAQIFEQIVAVSVKTRSNTNSVVSRNIKREKT